MTVVPIHQMRRALPEQGRIRIGKKGPRGAPQRLSTFRFTSHDELAIREIASHYGGTPIPWSDGPRTGEWEVITTTARVPVLLPPEPLGSGELATPIYELWSGGGCMRRCDGEIARVPAGDEMAETPCICATKGVMECKPKTRLTVILREIRFGGSWRVETGGWTAAHELPGMVDMLLGLQARGIIAGELVLREERKVKNGKTTKWMVPMLTTEASADELTAGHGVVGSLGPGADDTDAARYYADRGDKDDYVAALPSPDVDASDFFEGQPVIDVHLPPTDVELIDEQLAPMVEPQAPSHSALELDFLIAAGDLASLPECDGKSEDDVRHALVALVTRNRVTSSKLMTDEERTTGLDLVLDVLAGRRRILGFGAKGIRLSKARAEGTA